MSDRPPTDQIRIHTLCACIDDLIIRLKAELNGFTALLLGNYLIQEAYGEEGKDFGPSCMGSNERSL